VWQRNSFHFRGSHTHPNYRYKYIHTGCAANATKTFAGIKRITQFHSLKTLRVHSVFLLLIPHVHSCSFFIAHYVYFKALQSGTALEKKKGGEGVGGDNTSATKTRESTSCAVTAPGGDKHNHFHEPDFETSQA
jgi:hypothetical protein